LRTRMFNCPMCKKPLTSLDRECSSCHADLSLIINYVEDLAGGIARADLLTRSGRLAEAVFAYLEVLDVDPENRIARKQVGQVASAVRNFDSRPRRKPNGEGWSTSVWLLIVLGASLIAFAAGMQAERWMLSQQSTTSTETE
jgi:hypothetical protein